MELYTSMGLETNQMNCELTFRFFISYFTKPNRPFVSYSKRRFVRS